MYYYNVYGNKTAELIQKKISIERLTKTLDNKGLKGCFPCFEQLSRHWSSFETQTSFILMKIVLESRLCELKQQIRNKNELHVNRSLF